SGDYHQIHRREVALAARIAQLEATHHRTWSEPADAPDAPAAYRELQGLALEIAAILDVELLEELAGGKAVKSVRMAVTSDHANVPRKPLSPELEALVPLLAGEDLKTFLTLLLGSVLKRASLSRRGPAAAPTASAKGAATPAAAAPEPSPMAALEMDLDFELL